MLGKIEGRRRRGGQRIRWLDGITDSMGHEFELGPRVGDGQGSLHAAGLGSQRVGHDRVTELTDIKRSLGNCEIF